MQRTVKLTRHRETETSAAVLVGLEEKRAFDGASVHAVNTTGVGTDDNIVRELAAASLVHVRIQETDINDRMVLDRFHVNIVRLGRGCRFVIKAPDWREFLTGVHYPLRALIMRANETKNAVSADRIRAFHLKIKLVVLYGPYCGRISRQQVSIRILICRNMGVFGYVVIRSIRNVEKQERRAVGTVLQYELLARAKAHY